MASVRLLLLLLPLTSLACPSTKYTPTRSKRLSRVVHGGLHYYVREGQTHSASFLSGGLSQAVKGVPAAETAARHYERGTTAGLLTSMAGLTLAFGSLIYVNEQEEDDPRYEAPAVVPIIAVVGVVADTVARDGDSPELAVPWTLAARLAYGGPEAYRAASYTLVEVSFPVVKTGAELQKELLKRPRATFQQVLMEGDEAIRPAQFRVLLGRRYVLCAMAAPISDPTPIDWATQLVECQPITISVTPSQGEVMMNVTLPYAVPAPDASSPSTPQP